MRLLLEVGGHQRLENPPLSSFPFPSLIGLFKNYNVALSCTFVNSKRAASRHGSINCTAPLIFQLTSFMLRSARRYSPVGNGNNKFNDVVRVLSSFNCFIIFLEPAAIVHRLSLMKRHVNLIIVFLYKSQSWRAEGGDKSLVFLFMLRSVDLIFRHGHYKARQSCITNWNRLFSAPPP